RVLPAERLGGHTVLFRQAAAERAPAARHRAEAHLRSRQGVRGESAQPLLVPEGRRAGRRAGQTVGRGEGRIPDGIAVARPGEHRPYTRARLTHQGRFGLWRAARRVEAVSLRRAQAATSPRVSFSQPNAAAPPTIAREPARRARMSGHTNLRYLS